MTLKQIKEELKTIYQERKNWQGGKGPFDRLSVNQRELILCKQYILHRLEEAKRIEDKQRELFYLELYKITESYRRDWITTSKS